MKTPLYLGPRVRYEDRSDAGRRLVASLKRYRGTDALVVALPRGGVPVGFQVASGLRLPLDILSVRKLSTPGHPELAMGAIATGGVRVLNDALILGASIPADAIDAAVDRATQELNRRERVYRGHASTSPVVGRTILLVDDGVATGSTMLAAIQALRQRGAADIVVAVPVASSDTVQLLEHAADVVICPYQPSALGAVGQAYVDFQQVTDEEVRAFLRRSEVRRRARGNGSGSVVGIGAD